MIINSAYPRWYVFSDIQANEEEEKTLRELFRKTSFSVELSFDRWDQKPYIYFSKGDPYEDASTHEYFSVQSGGSFAYCPLLDQIVDLSHNSWVEKSKLFVI